MTEHPVLTLDLVRRTADEVVTQNPEKIVELCKYVRPDYEGPSCLVGVLLWQLGWSYEELKYYDDNPDGDSGIRSVIERGKVQTDNAVTADYLTMLQDQQDLGRTWLVAYRKAEATVESADTEDGPLKS